MDLQGFTYYRDHWYQASATSLSAAGPWQGEVTICAKAASGAPLKILDRYLVPGEFFSEGEAWQHATDWARLQIDGRCP
ncbi:hypothetical protein SAMN05216345_1115 [Cupriavidus sp. YR651]|nr:hypothetical protein SAMN05216345_1115 [Cupriavidus sp. YR651]